MQVVSQLPEFYLSLGELRRRGDKETRSNSNPRHLKAHRGDYEQTLSHCFFSPSKSSFTTTRKQKKKIVTLCFKGTSRANHVSQSIYLAFCQPGLFKHMSSHSCIHFRAQETQPTSSQIHTQVYVLNSYANVFLIKELTWHLHITSVSLTLILCNLRIALFICEVTVGHISSPSSLAYLVCYDSDTSHQQDLKPCLLSRWGTISISCYIWPRTKPLITGPL